jgi:hypothetical protein
VLRWESDLAKYSQAGGWFLPQIQSIFVANLMGKHSGSVDSRVLQRIQAMKPGAVFAPTDLAALGPRTAVASALSRYLKAGLVKRPARGLYQVPEAHPLFGELQASPDRFRPGAGREGPPQAPAFRGLRREPPRAFRAGAPAYRLPHRRDATADLRRPTADRPPAHHAAQHGDRRENQWSCHSGVEAPGQRAREQPSDRSDHEGDRRRDIGLSGPLPVTSTRRSQENLQPDKYPSRDLGCGGRGGLVGVANQTTFHCQPDIWASMTSHIKGTQTYGRSGTPEDVGS